RDKVLHYADTSWEKDPVAMGNKLKARMDDHGFKFLKMDIGIQICRGIEGCITRLPADTIDSRMTQHPFTGIRVTDKGLDVIAEFVATVRDIIGYEIPLASDHYGHMAVEDQIKLAQKLDQFNLAWYEDMVPWWWTEQLKRIKDSCNTPILTGEDIYLKEDFKKLFEAQAISICHPDNICKTAALNSHKITINHIC
ncbi:unnamed protein product, partial [marine sediment metagenome]